MWSHRIARPKGSTYDGWRWDPTRAICPLEEKKKKEKTAWEQFRNETQFPIRSFRELDEYLFIWETFLWLLPCYSFHGVRLVVRIFLMFPSYILLLLK